MICAIEILRSCYLNVGIIGLTFFASNDSFFGGLLSVLMGLLIFKINDLICLVEIWRSCLLCFSCLI